MSTGHKKGEDVVNNFIKTLGKAQKSVEQGIQQADHNFKLSSLTRTERLIGRFQNDPRLVKARDMLRAPATGEMNDLNSQNYGAAAQNFQSAMELMAQNFRDAINAINSQKLAKSTGSKQSVANPHLNKASNSKNQASKAWSTMVDNGFDQNAAQALLSENINQRAINERRDVISAIEEAMKFFAIRGKDIVECMHDEIVSYINVLMK